MNGTASLTGPSRRGHRETRYGVARCPDNNPKTERGKACSLFTLYSILIRLPMMLFPVLQSLQFWEGQNWPIFSLASRSINFYGPTTGSRRSQTTRPKRWYVGSEKNLLPTPSDACQCFISFCTVLVSTHTTIHECPQPKTSNQWRQKTMTIPLTQRAYSTRTDQDRASACSSARVYLRQPPHSLAE